MSESRGGQHRDTPRRQMPARGDQVDGATAVRPSGPRAPALDWRAMARARRHFLETGHVTEGIAQPILQSWRRSAAHGVSMDMPPDIEIPSRTTLRQLIESNEALVQASWGEVEALRLDLGDMNGLAILTDPEGRILMRTGDEAFSREADRLGLLSGVSWNERFVGTNAIGTALEEGRSVSIQGGEHFVDPNAVLNCSAVIVLDPRGDILGTLDLSTPATIPHLHLMALLGRSVSQIERNLFERQCGQLECMRLHANPFLIGSPHEGRLAFDGDILVGANRNAMSLLGLSWSAIGQLRFGDLFTLQPGGMGQQASPDDCMVRTPHGQTLFARMESPAKSTGTRVYQGQTDAQGQTDTTARDEAPRRAPHVILRELEDRNALRHVARRRIRAGALIHGSEEKDRSGEAVLIVAEGELRCFTSFEGKELTLFPLAQGEAMILRDHIQAEARTAGEVYILRHSEFEEVMRVSTDFSLAVMPVIEHLLRKSIDMIEDMVFHSVKYRLVRMVVDMAERSGRPTARGLMVEMRSSGEELAMSVGASRQTVSTAMAGLARDGYIERIGARTLLVPDLSRLKEDLETWS